MSKVENFFEPGDYLVEYNQFYLGCARVEINLHPAALAVRRDSWMPLQKRQVQSVQWLIAVHLSSSDRFWEMLGGSENLTQAKFTEKLFTDGGILNLYPADPQRRGFSFLRAYLSDVRQISGGDLTPGELNLQFNCAFELGSQRCFNRLPVQKRPAAAWERTAPDTAAVSRTLLKLLEEPLEAIAEQTLRMNFFAPDDAGSYVLTLNRCLSWSDHAPHTLEYLLTARFPIVSKMRSDQNLLNTANFLHDYHRSTAEANILLCRVHEVDFSGRKFIAGNTVTNSILRFSVLLG